MQLAYDYFAAHTSRGADQFLERYFEVTDQIALNPWSYAIKFDDYRRALILKSDFAIYYFIEPERSVIVAVVNARRHPRLIRDFVRGRRS